MQQTPQVDPPNARRNALKSGLLFIFFVVAVTGLLEIVNRPTFRIWQSQPEPVDVSANKSNGDSSRLMDEARVASNKNDHRLAIELLTQALAIDRGPNNTSRDLLAERGSEYNFLGVPDKAAADFDAALRIGYTNPISPDA
jgi:tetratricopeptide (TPR) repeat protein